jgi:hypothetical protein
MSIIRVVSKEPLSDAECRSLAPARAKRLAYSLSGRARYLLEMLTGEPAADDGGATPLNPQGRMGVDRSGPPWGDAHLHPVWSYGVAIPVTSVIFPAATGTYGHVLDLNTGTGFVRRLTARFWVRPHHSTPTAPYSRLYLRATGTSTGGTATATIRVYSTAEGEGGPSTSATVSTTGTAAFSTAAWCIVKPGWNERLLEIEQTSSTRVLVGPMSLNQIVRRSH